MSLLIVVMEYHYPAVMWLSGALPSVADIQVSLLNDWLIFHKVICLWYIYLTY